MDAGISYISLLSDVRGDLKKQTRKTASNANFTLHLFLLPPQPVPGTCCPEHPQHRPFSPSPWAPPGPFSSYSSAPTGKAPTRTGGVFGEAPLSSDFHGKRAVTPRRQHPTPQPNADRYVAKALLLPRLPHTCRASAWLEAAGESHGLPPAALEEPEAPSPPSAAPRPPPAKALSDLRWRTVDRHMLLLFIAPSLCSD